MTVKELIEKLQTMPQDMSVNVFDWKKNFDRGGGDPVSDGITEITDVSVIPDDDTIKEMREQYDDEELNQWVGIGYDNDDYPDSTEVKEEVIHPLKINKIPSEFNKGINTR